MNNNQNRVPGSVLLEEYVTSYIIFIDACSWMQPSIETFEDSIYPFLYKHNASLVVPVCVYNEICSKLKCGIPFREKCADTALRVMGRLQKAGFIQYYKDDDDDLGDSLFDSIFRKKRIHHRLMLITNDYDLGISIRDVNNVSYSYGFPVVVKALAEDGTLMEVEDILKKKPYTGRPSGKQANPVKPSYTCRPVKQTPYIPAFAMTDQITSIPDTPLQVSSVPGKGDYVLIGEKKVVLEDVIGEGGEGIVYRCSIPGAAVKIFHREQITRRRQEKLRRMTAKHLDVEGIAWPLCTVENQNNEFTGYLMREVKNGISLEDAVFNITALKTDHPDWTRRNTVAIAVDFLDKVRFLHRNNVLLCDVKGDNIILCGDKVWITDCDSFQIEGFPCPVATEAFTPPELQDRKCDTFLRTFQNEYFSLAVLIFMTLIPGKSPYAHQGGAGPAENIRKMEFPYPLRENSAENQPGGMWRYLWSHLPYRVKADFYSTFKAGEEHASVGTRLDAEYWYQSMVRYLTHDLDLMIQNDAMSDSLFPTRFKKHKDMVYGKCEGCGGERTVEFLQKHGGYCYDCYEEKNIAQCEECGSFGIGPKMKEGLCYDCYRKKHEAKCSGCGNTVLDTQLTEGLCKTCMDKPHHVIKCSACPHTFEFSNRSYFYYRDKGWEDPKLCPDCRRIKKQAFQEYQERHRNGRTPRDTDTSVKAVRKPVDTGGISGTIQSIRDRMKKI